ncbi:MAG: M64 family metallopeptidase [Phycisphaerales bacterium]
MQHRPTSSTRAIHTLAHAALLALLAPALHAEPADNTSTPAPGMERVYFDVPLPDGSLSGGFIDLPFVEPALFLQADAPPAPWTTILDNGPVSNRIDLVIVGDGYTEPQLPAYATHAQSAVNALFATQPFSTYKNYFNVHRVDVISPESGVDHDPTQGILRNTALDMGFWCNGTERLLCVNVSKAYSYANNALDVQQVFAIANSIKYGGAGYTSSELATFAGGNASSAEIAIHELAHSFGDLADEYDYGGPANYTGPERPERNVSKLDAAAMAIAGSKWAVWLNDPAGVFDGPVSCYQGAYYSTNGIYRPSPNSKMRTLGRPFNAPSVEGLIINVYRTVRPIDNLSPPLTNTLNENSIPSVIPMQPVGHSLSVQWLLNGNPIPGATSTSLDLSVLSLPAGLSTLSVRLIDNTPWVRSQSARDQWLTQTATWNLVNNSTPCPGDVNGDRVVNFFDLNILLGSFGQTVPVGTLGDLNNDARVDFLDLNILLSFFGVTC